MDISTQIANKTALFLEHINLQSNHSQISEKIIAFFRAGLLDKEVLYKNSSLYFIESEETKLVERVESDFADHQMVRFDGLHVMRIDPDYYLGPEKESSGFGIRITISESDSYYSNNNNNNNNNNGNNG